jgi:hypothetical protein
MCRMKHRVTGHVVLVPQEDMGHYKWMGYVQITWSGR